jgi:hypothetical protein
MTEQKSLAEMSEEEFDALIEAYLERIAQGVPDEMDALAFFQELERIFADEQEGWSQSLPDVNNPT